MTSSEWKRRGKEAGASLVTRDYKLFSFFVKLYPIWTSPCKGASKSSGPV